MPRIVLAGRVSHIVRSSVSFYTIGAVVVLRRLFGRKLVPEWPRDMEIVNLFLARAVQQGITFSRYSRGESLLR